MLIKLDEVEEMQLQAYEDVTIHKERIKRHHDRNLMRQEFYPGQHVLFYNLRLELFRERLKSKWSGPFIVNKVSPNGVVEIPDLGDIHIFKVNGQRLNNYVEGEVPTTKVSRILSES